MRAPIASGLRAASLLYVALLWLGVLPVGADPLRRCAPLVAAQRAARAAFAAVTLSPGDAIFTGSPGEWKIAANCLRVTGRTTAGERRTLYQNDCPDRPGPRLRNPPFDQALEYMTRISRPAPLAPGSRTWRRARDITAYFCRSPLEAHPPLRSATLRQVYVLQSAWSGERVRSEALQCALDCAVDAPPSPRCELRGRPRSLE